MLMVAEKQEGKEHVSGGQDEAINWLSNAFQCEGFMVQKRVCHGRQVGGLLAISSGMSVPYVMGEGGFRN